MDDGIEIFMPDRGQNFEFDAVIFQLPWRNIVRTAINCDLVPAKHESSGQMFREGFESAIAGGNTSRAENSDAHQLRIVTPKFLPLPGRRGEFVEQFLAN